VILSSSSVGLTALVLSGLSISSPVAAVTKNVVSNQSHWLAKIMLTMDRAMMGAVLGMLASYMGMSKVIEKSVDDKQKAELIILRNKIA
jgi:hypothetical protein